MSLSGSGLCTASLLVAVLLCSVLGAPADKKVLPDDKLSETQVAQLEKEAKDLNDLLNNTIVGLDEPAKNSSKEEGSGQQPPEFPRVEVDKNDCPTCVPGSFRWRK